MITSYAMPAFFKTWQTCPFRVAGPSTVMTTSVALYMWLLDWSLTEYSVPDTLVVVDLVHRWPMKTVVLQNIPVL